MIGWPGTHVVEVREVGPPDAERWIHLRHRLWPAPTIEELSKDVYAFFNRGTPLVAAAFLAWHKNEAIGFLELSVRSYVPGAGSLPAPFVEGWFVDVEWRRRGVGRMLVRRQRIGRAVKGIASWVQMRMSITYSAPRHTRRRAFGKSKSSGASSRILIP